MTTYTEEEVRLIIAGAVAEEREACAKVAEAECEALGWSDMAVVADRIVAAIRARGETK